MTEATNNDQPSAEVIFSSALEIEDPAARSIYLDKASGNDHELHHRVEKLLDAYGRAGSFLESGAPSLAASAGEPIREGPGTVIGPYQLLEQIGEGSFGLVFMAEQQKPIRRKVAVKILKLGMDSRQICTRFEAERQALALMDHASIAKVLDAGETDTGRPYFVMELCRGVPITDYCDQNHLNMRERLELFSSVCQAVQHAHQKGIIHRDLKPANVLVTLHDGAPVVKVIDFGIAKALGQPLTDKTLVTSIAQLIGTPLYMSPEQTELGGLDIDTRSDIYSLGLLLYELVTGTTPFDKERLRTVGYDEMRRIIREAETPKPSTRVRTLGQPAIIASTQRKSDPQRLSRLLRGELDWIVMKCLEKDRNRRYETASALGADVRHYLHDEPVAACPPSVWYRLCKLARRHRGKLLMAGLGLASLFLVVAAVAGSIGWVASDRAARDAALDHQVDMTLDEAVSLTETGRWPEALDATERVEKLLDAGGRRERPPRLRDLQRDVVMARRLEDIYNQLGSAVLDVGVSKERAAQGDDRAYAEAFRVYGIDLTSLPVAEAVERIRACSIRLELARALDMWSSLRRRAGNGERPDWQQLLEVAKAADSDDWRNQLRTALQRDDRQALAALAASADVGRLPAGTLALLGHTLAEYLGAPDQAVALLRQAQRQYPGDLWINSALGWYCFSAVRPRQYDEAARFYTAALAVRPSNAFLRNCLGRAFLAKGAYAEAIAEFSKAIEMQRNYPAPWFNRGVAYAHQREWESAQASCREAVRLMPSHSGAQYSLGYVLWLQGQFAEAEPYYREVIRLKPDDAANHYNLGLVLGRQGKRAEAEAAYREAIHLNPDYAAAHYHLGASLDDRGALDAAEVAYREAIRLKPDDALAYDKLGWVLGRQGKHSDAETAYREAVRLKPDFTKAHNNLGWVLRCQGKHSEAETAYREAIRLKPDYALAHANLAWVLGRQSRHAEAEAAYREAIRLKPDYAEAHNNLAWLLATCADSKYRKPQEALALAERAVDLAPKEGPYWNTLGAARYRTGDYQAALAAVEKAMALTRGGDSYQWFFLAMDHWQLGDKKKARQWYDQATRWMDKNQAKNEELRRLRTEAGQLLEVDNKKD